MHLDFDTVPETFFEADICIIGSGAAGFACAVSLLPTGLRVLVVEGGTHTYSEPAANIHRGTLSNQLHTGIHEARERIVGGTTTRWGGQALPFLAEDFQPRPHVRNSGWPIAKAVLAPYYHKAETILGTDSAVPFDWQPWHLPQPFIAPAVAKLILTKWCKIPNFAQQHGDKIAQSASVHLLRNASATALLPSAAHDRVATVTLKSLSGKQGQVRARYVIAAGGAIETTRLFLSSTQFGEQGLGNQHQLVGKFFQDHVSAVVGQVQPTSRRQMQELFDTFYKHGFKYLPRIQLNPALARQLGVLHASAQLVFTNKNKDLLSLAKDVVARARARQLPNFQEIKSLLNLSFFRSLAKAALRWKLKNRGSAPRTGPIWLEIHSEQEPLADSYVALGTETDALGMARVRLHWTVSDLTLKTMQAMGAAMKEEFERTHLGTVQLEPWVLGHSANPRRWVIDTYHQAGGLRMANEATQGVVDTSCKVFGVDNLYVASSAVFPTSSFSNPTMTIIALAIRVAEEVAGRCAAPAPPA